MRTRVVVLFIALAWCASAAGQPFSAESRDLAFAVGLYRDAQYRLAEEELAAFIGRYPQSDQLSRACLLRADCLVELRRYEGALSEARPLTVIAGELGTRAFLAAARALLGLHRGEEAEGLLREALDRSSHPEIRAEALHFLGWSLRHRGACDEALRFFGESSSLDWAGSLNSTLHAGWCLLELERTVEAESVFADLLGGGAPSPLLEEAMVGRGVALLALGDHAGRALIDEGLQAQIGPSVRQAGQIAVAEWLHASDRLDEAETRYRRAIGLGGDGVPRAMYGLGWCLLDHGEPAGADSVLDQLIERYPGYGLLPGARYGRGVALLRTDRKDDAWEAFSDLLELHPGTPETHSARWQLASLAMDAGLWDAVDEHLEGLLGQAAPSWLGGQARALASEAAFRRGDYRTTVEHGRRALTDSLPEDVRRATTLRVGVALVQVDLGREAVAVLDTLAQEWPTADVWLWLGEALFQSGSFENAAEAYGEVLEQPGDSLKAQARYGRAWSLLKLGRWQEAEDEFSALAGVGDLGEDALLRQGDALFNQQRYDEAAALYRRVSSSTPDSNRTREALLRLAAAQTRAHDHEEGLATLAQLLESPGDLVDDALMLRGDVLFQEGLYDEAASVYTEVIGLHMDRDLRARALYRLGDSHYNQGLYEEAARAYQRFLVAFRDDERLAHAAEGYLRSLARHDSPAVAVSVADSLSTSPDSLVRAVAAHSKAGLLLDQGDEEAAIRAYRHAAMEFPWSPWADRDLLNAGQLLSKLHRNGEALQTYRDLRESYPRSDLLPQSLYSEAEVLVRDGENDRAAGLLSELRAGDPASALAAPATLMEARIRTELGQPAEARALLTDLLAMEPSADLAAEARLELAGIALDEQRWADARRWAAWVVEYRSDALAAQAQRLMGESFAGEGEWEKAQREFLRVAYLYPSATEDVELAKRRAAECEARLHEQP